MLTELSPEQLLDAILQAEKKITSKKELLNNLNVYPVPDGDTGTNMSLTLKEIAKELRKKKDYTLSELAEVLGEASLMGARGNSGVILSQFIGGFSQTIQSKEFISRHTLLKAFQNGTKEAYDSVSDPVEGTILTIMKAATKEIEKKSDHEDILKILASSIHSSQETLRKTPDMLQKLKDAGVVDAGGAGFAYFLEGIYESLHKGEESSITATDDFISPRLARVWQESYGPFGSGGFRSFLDFNWQAVKHFLTNFEWLSKRFWSIFSMGKNAISMKKAVTLTKRLGNQLKWQNIKKTNTSIFKLLRVWHQTPEERYCMEVILENVSNSPKQIRSKLENKCSSLIIAKKGRYTKIHLHSIDEARSKKLLTQFGKVIQFKSDDIHKQHKEFISKKFEVIEEKGSHCLIVVNGKGFKQLYESFDGIETIDGSDTMNPSVSDFLKALTKIEEHNIIIIPNNDNTYLSADNAGKKSDKNVTVLKTTDQAQGLTALLNFNKSSTITDNMNMMENALNLLTTCLISKSTKDTTIGKVKVQQGSYIALNNKKIISHGAQMKNVILDALKSLIETKQLITLYYGNDSTKQEAEIMKRQIQKIFGKEVQLYNGGQPHYYYLITLE